MLSIQQERQATPGASPARSDQPTESLRRQMLPSLARCFRPPSLLVSSVQYTTYRCLTTSTSSGKHYNIKYTADSAALAAWSRDIATQASNFSSIWSLVSLSAVGAASGAGFWAFGHPQYFAVAAGLAGGSALSATVMMDTFTIL